MEGVLRDENNGGVRCSKEASREFQIPRLLRKTDLLFSCFPISLSFYLPSVAASGSQIASVRVCGEGVSCNDTMQSPKPRSGSSKISSSKSLKINPICDDDLDSAPCLEQNLSTKLSAMAERRSQRGLEQPQLAQIQEELKRTKHQLANLQEEKSCALHELGKLKKILKETDVQLHEALLRQSLAEEKWEMEKLYRHQLEQASVESAQKRDEAWQLELEANQKQHALDLEALWSVTQELTRIKQELSLAAAARDEAIKMVEEATAQANSSHYSSTSSDLVSESNDLSDEESKTGESNDFDCQTSSLLESLKLQVENARCIEARLAEKESQIDRIKQELAEVRESESRTSKLLSESRIRAVELGHQLENAKETENKTAKSLHCLSLQLEQTKISLEEAKLEIGTLHESNSTMATTHNQGAGTILTGSSEVTNQVHGSNVQESGENGSRFSNTKELPPPDVCKLEEEMNFLTNQLNLAIGEGEKSTKALDGFALALKEVTTEVSELKAKLASTEAELATSRTEAKYASIMLKNNEEKYQALLNEARKEIAEVRETNERLKLEADEAFASWNGKELCFVQCMRQAEEEFAREKEEFQRVIGSSEATEVAEAAKQESHRLRDIIKQAVHEATVAKEAAEIARAENSQLKDSLTDMAMELERLKMNEASALETVAELQKSLSKIADSNKGSEGKELKKTSGHHKESKSMTRIPLELPKISPPPYLARHTPANLSPVDFDILEGSIFTVESPKATESPLANKRPRHRKAHSELILGPAHSDDFGEGENHLDEMENVRSLAAHRKKKALLSRFGGFLWKNSLVSS